MHKDLWIAVLYEKDKENLVLFASNDVDVGSNYVEMVK